MFVDISKKWHFPDDAIYVSFDAFIDNVDYIGQLYKCITFTIILKHVKVKRSRFLLILTVLEFS